MDLAEAFGIDDISEKVSAVEENMRTRVLGRGGPLAELSWKQVSAGGKRLRPALVIACASLGRRDLTEGVITAASAVELVHTGSLVHDDIMDEAATRRGVQTINDSHGDSVALVAGDYLLGLAGQAATSVSAEVGSALSSAIVSLCDGQFEETWRLFNADRTYEQYLKAIEGKTAALMEAACLIGGLAGEADGEIVPRLRKFGVAFGISFQIVDDVLDIVANEQTVGKPTSNDFRAGVATLPLILSWQEGELDYAREEFLRVKAAAHDDPSIARVDESIVRQVVADLRHGPFVEASIAEARSFALRAEKVLGELEDQPLQATIKTLASLPLRYMDKMT